MKEHSGWKLRTLEQIAEIKSGATPLRSKGNRYYTDNGVPWVKTGDLTNSFIYKTDEQITETAINESGCQIFPEGTLLVAMYGGFNQIGRTGLLTKPAAINQAISAVVVKTKEINNLFLLYWLNENITIWKRSAASSRKDPNITRNDVCKFPVLIPPSVQQNAIVQVLSNFDSAIEKTEQLIRAKEEYKQILLQKIIASFLNNVKQIKDIADVDKETLTEKTDPKYRFKYITLSDVEKGRINDKLEEWIFKDSPSRARKVVKTGDIILGTVRPNLQSFARIKDNVKDLIASTGFCVITAKKNNDGEYIYQLLFSDFITRQINSLIVGSNYPSINSEEIRNLKIPIPNYDRQKEIGYIFYLIDKENVLFRKKLELLKLQKKGLMQQLLTGKIRIKTNPPSREKTPAADKGRK